MVITSKSEIWNAVNGRSVDIDCGYFATTDSANEKYHEALAQGDFPAVFLEKPLFSKLLQRLDVLSKEIRVLKPTHVRHFLRAKDLQGTSDSVASMLLEFCLLDAMSSKTEGNEKIEIFHDLGAIQLWPTLAATLLAPRKDTPLLIPRDDSEMQLFGKSRIEETLDLTKLTCSSRQLLFKEPELLPAVMRHREINDLVIDWPIIYLLPPTSGSQKGAVSRPSTLDGLLGNIWNWISRRVQDGSGIDVSAIGKLLLLPVNGKRIRTLASDPHHPPILIIEPNDPLHQIVTKIAKSNLVETSLILDVGLLPASLLERFRKDPHLRRDTGSTTIDYADAFVNWLVGGKEVLSQIPDSDKEELLAHLGDITSPYKLRADPSPALIAQLKRLPFYGKLVCQPPFE